MENPAEVLLQVIKLNCDPVSVFCGSVLYTIITLKAVPNWFFYMLPEVACKFKTKQKLNHFIKIMSVATLIPTP